LIVLAGPDEGRVFPIDGDSLLIGRSRATGTALIDGHVARVHCQIVVDKGHVHLSDFDSPGGTFVNGQKIRRQELKPGDLIRIGKTSLQFTDVDTIDPKPAARATRWADALVGTTIGHYKVGPVLGRGRNGYVLHGRDTRRNIPIALKVLDSSVLADDKAVERFIAAMKVVLPLRHPHLVKTYGAGRAGGHCWIATEYLRAESLAAVISRFDEAGRIDWRNIVRIGIYLTRALEYAHSKKVLHTNVTPQNILVGAKPQETKLTDLRVAAAIEVNPLTPISAAGTPSESLSYQPPERTFSGATFDVRGDLYGLGATLYASLAGRAPLQASTTDELIERIRTETPAKIETLGLPQQLSDVVFRMLAKDPAERFASAREVLKALTTTAKEQAIAL
jgi:serine/threonine-protein kinase